ncbi:MULTISPECIES: hypothetical protein [Staphylococcus]|uniref:Mid2-like cell wall stress sensor domain protein n=1 Tax=Staphylococcus hsinchuensis TaxID=3051183 RepID=A0ABZ3EDI3_9STAP|nr:MULTISPECIES: hypothetical protein [unclassified Staphylococcus]
MNMVIGLILIVLLILSIIPNFKKYQQAKANGEKTTRFAIMFGIDTILLILILIALFYK